MAKLTFLGTGAAISEGRAYTTILVNDSVLLDVAPTAPFHLLKMKKDLTKIKSICITHFHGDHTFGLPFLFLEYAFACKRKTELTVVGPEGIKEFTEALVASAYRDAANQILEQVPVNYISIPNDGGSFNVEEIRGVALPMSHGEINAFGYLLGIEGKTVSFSGDTGICKNLMQLVNRSDINIIECSFLDSKITGHLNFEDIKMLSQKLTKEQKLVLVHLGKEVSPFLLLKELPEAIVPSDLDEIEFT